MAVTLTDSAERRVQDYLGKRGRGVGLRLGIRKTGCSGFAYTIDYADEIAPEDTVFEDGAVKVIVEAASLPFLDGTVVDFVKDGLNEAFRFRNPNVAAECGCGESFTV